MEVKDIYSNIRNGINSKIRGIKIFAIVVSILMILIGVLALINPEVLLDTIKIIIALAIFMSGAYLIVDYFTLPYFFRNGFKLASGIISVLLGYFIFRTPTIFTVSTFAYIFAFISLINGINTITASKRYDFFQVESTKYMKINGFINIILAIILFFMPFQTSIALSMILGIYLIVEGISFLIEVLTIKTIPSYDKIKKQFSDDIIDVEYKEEK